MATTYKTPGVYIEEIPKFPPSIAPVDTAIPAFIGYTERAVDRNGSDLTNRPKRIESLVEYELYFGGPQSESEITVTIVETTIATPSAPVGITATAALDEGAGRNTSSITRCSCSMRTAARPAISSPSDRSRRPWEPTST